MKKENIILYARILRSVFETRDSCYIAKQLGYEIIFIDADIKFILANTYRTKENKRKIIINSNFDEVSTQVLCAHELGHAVLNHDHKKNYKDKNIKNEYDVNLFAVSLLFDDDDFNMPIIKMSNYVLQQILDANIAMP